MSVEYREQTGRVVRESFGQAAETADVCEQDRGVAYDGHSHGSGQQAVSTLLVRLTQVHKPSEIVCVIGLRRFDGYACDHNATSSAAREAASMVAAVAAMPGPLRSTAVTPAFCSERLAAESSSFRVTTTT